MKENRNKKDIIDKIILKDLSIELSKWVSYWYYWDDDDYDKNWGCCDGCGFHSCDGCYEYEYLPENQQSKPIEYISKRFRVTKSLYSHGKLINMDTVYSKELLRQKKLEAILDGGKFSLVNKKTYLFDMLSEESKNNLDNIK